MPMSDTSNIGSWPIGVSGKQEDKYHIIMAYYTGFDLRQHNYITTKYQ